MLLLFMGALWHLTGIVSQKQRSAFLYPVELHGSSAALLIIRDLYFLPCISQ